MPSLPPRDNRVLQTVDFFKEEILAGRLKGKLPGERELAKRFSISRITLRKALQLLEDEKWISPAQPGCRRETLKSSKPSGKSSTNKHGGVSGTSIVTLAPLPLENLPSTVRLDHTRLNSYCARAGINLRHRALDLSHLKRPAYRLREFIKQNPADLYLLLLSNKETQQWFYHKKIPCVVLGSAWPGSDLPSADLDQRALGVHVASTLTRLGHQHVGMLYPEPEKRGLQLFVEGLRQAVPEMNLEVARQDDSADEVLKALRTLVSDPDNCPSAIILPRITYVTTAIGLLPSLGLTVPDHISLICLVHDEALHFHYPQVAGYRVPVDAYPKAIFNLAVKRLMHPSNIEVEHALVMPEFVPAESLRGR